VRVFIQREGQSESAMELHGELELLYLFGRFFDRVLYYAAVGYEQERNRIGGKQKRRKGDAQKIIHGASQWVRTYAFCNT
jgi:hypothetical protein